MDEKEEGGRARRGRGLGRDTRKYAERPEFLAIYIYIFKLWIRFLINDQRISNIRTKSLNQIKL